MLLYCNIHMYYLRPATLAFVRRFRREAALAGAAVRVMGVPVRVNACAAAAKSKAEKAQRIMVPRPLFFPVHSRMPHSVWHTSTGFQQFSRAEKCARLVLYCKSSEKSCEHLCKSSRSSKFCRVVAPVIFRIFAFRQSEADGSNCYRLREHQEDCGGFKKERQTLNSHTNAHTHPQQRLLTTS